ncbi:helix-turn-helix domain-containing protein [Clostridium sp. C2-6-12]|uniref:GH39 family glycosyl hydrolase n=1 Tax=Clostridium sp. C2-6-12 TaxID=2698832 RepID=UPI001368F0EB|nr:helix-turn-helix domain-containing protein [Clostridium sp. C2-6-12]
MLKTNYNKEKIISYNILAKQKDETHFHKDIELIYVLEGNMEINVEDDIYNLNADDILVINPSNKHSYKCSENILIGNFIVSFEKLSCFVEMDSILFRCNSVIDKENSFEEVTKVIKLIINNYVKGKEKEELYEYSLFYQLLELLTNNFMINKDMSMFSEKENRDGNRINEIANYIRRHYNKPITLNDLAKKLNLSIPYLSKYFKNNFGVKFIDYLYDIRLRNAIEDLLNNDATIKNSALDNGFPSTVVFNKIFKAKYNIPPSVYIKKMKTNKQNICEEIELKEEEILDRLKNLLLENNIYDNWGLVQNKKHIVIDIREEREYDKSWNKIINIGAASDLLESDIQEHMLILKNELKYEYVRFWNIFANNMYLGINNDEGKYNFDKIDKVLDFLVENKIKPFIQLRQKPKRLNKTEYNHVIIEDESMVNIKVNEWKNIIKNFSKHIVNRYGIEEAQTWCFEIWWDEDVKLDLDFYDIFNIAYKELKFYIPSCKVGGPEFTANYGVKQFISYIKDWKKILDKSDYLSLSIFPYDIVIENGNKCFIRSMDEDFIANQLKEIEEELKKEGYNNKQIYITEWNNTVSERNYMNDSCYKGAYIMKNIIDNIDDINILGYFIGSDLYSQFYDSNNLLNGGAGLISKNGIKKPAYYAIEFMNRLGGKIIDKGENYILTTNNDNEYFMACHNYKHFNKDYYSKSEDEINPKEQETLFNDYNNLYLNFELKNLLNGQYNVKIYSISSQNGSILDEWINIDGDISLGKDELDYLKRISAPRLKLKRCTVEQKILKLPIDLIPNEFSIIHIYRD